MHDILTSAMFWKGVKELLVVSESIVCLLRQCDKGVPVVGKVYYAMFFIGEELGAVKEGTSEQHPGVKLSAVKYEQIRSAGNTCIQICIWLGLFWRRSSSQQNMDRTRMRK